MALILQHYWQSLNTCPKAVSARGTQTAVKCVSLGQGGQKCITPFQVINGLWRPSYPPGEKRPHDRAKAWPLTTTHLNHQRSKQANARVYSLSPLFGGRPLPRIQNGTPSPDVFCVFPHLPKCCILWLPAARRHSHRTILLWVSMTRLDDLDNAGAEEDDSCQETVKLAFLPLHFALRSVSGEETVSFDPLCLL